MTHIILFDGQGAMPSSSALRSILSNTAGIQRFQELSELLGFSDIPSMFAYGHATETWYMQPIIFVYESLLFDELDRRSGHAMTPTGNLYYGHSLVLYTALYAAAVSPYEELLHMVISRGLCMQHCSEAVDSGMMAVMTYDTEAIAYVCEIVTRLGGHIYPANYNSFGETVIGGTTSALAQAKELFNMMNIRSVDVQVCGAFHTKLLKSAAAAFNPECKHFDSHAAEYVYVDQSIKDIPSWTSRLTEQIVRPTDFVSTLPSLLTAGGVRPNPDGNSIIEIGPNTTLCRYVNEMAPRHSPLAITQLDDIPNTLLTS